MSKIRTVVIYILITEIQYNFGAIIIFIIEKIYLHQNIFMSVKQGAKNIQEQYFYLFIQTRIIYYEKNNISIFFSRMTSKRLRDTLNKVLTETTKCNDLTNYFIIKT